MIWKPYLTEESHGLLVSLTEAVTLDKIYEELKALREEVSYLAMRMIPEVELDPYEFAELDQLIEESKSDPGIPWEQVKAELKAKNLI